MKLKTMEKHLLVVDLSNQLYRASAAYPSLSSSGVFTGGLYGVIEGLQKTIFETNCTHLIFCEDVKPYIREKQYPEYKSVRKSAKDEELVERKIVSEKLVKDLCKVLKWPIWGIQGFEYDDLLAHIATKYRHRFKTITAMSNDSDLYQLFKWPSFQISKGKKGIYTHSDYSVEWGLSSRDLCLALAMTGTHNDVAGIPGIGEVTARKILRDPPRLREVLKDHGQLIERNLSLITLPHPDFPTDIAIPDLRHPFLERDFMKFCGRYDITVTKKMIEAFERLGK